MNQSDRKAMTSVISFSPAVELRRFQRELDNLFQDMMTPAAAQEGPAWKPRLDVTESEEGYLLRLDLPGVAREDLSIEFHDGVLTLAGERKSDVDAEHYTHLCTERRHGRFERAVNLPKDADPQQIEATLRDGVLTVRVAKAEASKPRRIEIA